METMEAPEEPPQESQRDKASQPSRSGIAKAHRRRKSGGGAQKPPKENGGGEVRGEVEEEEER
jgi:hypothetical protein